MDQVKGVFWVEAFHKLTMVVTKDKELNVSGERLHATGETSGFASQSFEVMT